MMEYIQNGHNSVTRNYVIFNRIITNYQETIYSGDEQLACLALC